MREKLKFFLWNLLSWVTMGTSIVVALMLLYGLFELVCSC